VASIEQVAGFDAIVLPGGFGLWRLPAHGRDCAVFSRDARVEKFVRARGLVLGICNGFQILCEAGLLPGVLTRNAGLRFICRQVHIRIETTDTPFTVEAKSGQVLKMPMHMPKEIIFATRRPSPSLSATARSCSLHYT